MIKATTDERRAFMIVYDVIVNGKIQETIRPKRQKLREIYDYVNEQMKDM